MVRITACLVLALAAWSTPAAAHPAPFSYLDVRLEPGALDVGLVVHVLDVSHDIGVPEAQLLDASTLASHASRIVALLGPRLAFTVDGRSLTGISWSAPEPVPDRHGLRIRTRVETARPAGVLGVSALMFPYDPQHQTFVNIYEGGALTTQGILSRERQSLEYFAGTRQGSFAVVRKFVASGAHHILIGPDHLLFLVGLLLLGGTVRRLALLVTAFTVAHSVTLTAAVLGIFNPPASIVEPAIALSIVYVGADNLTVRGGRDMRGWIAFAFGLIHGFGFANVLREMDLPARALGLSLFSFNVGVELGQLIVVIGVASALAAVRAKSEVAGRRLAFAGSIVVIAAGAFWFVQRVFLAA